MAPYSHIIWDWNGTLFDDVAVCVEAVNTMLGQRGLPTLPSLAAYRSVFGFPIQDYYRRVGFDFDVEPYADLAADYIPLYHRLASRAPLFPGTTAILEDAREAGLHQVILSASQVDNLMSQIKLFGIEGFFDELLGLPDILAASKVDIGRQYIARVKPDRVLLVGDTIHDKEVADALGADCVLVASGHQNKPTLQGCGATVVDSLTDLRDILFNPPALWGGDQSLQR